MKIYSSHTQGVGVWTLKRSIAEMYARGRRDVYSATLAGVVFIVPPDATSVLPRNVVAALRDASGVPTQQALTYLRKQSFFKGFDAIIDPVNFANEQLVYVLDADALHRVRRA
jgi:hypothetical protein